jgi:type II secretory pathway pseudopilin PulG
MRRYAQKNQLGFTLMEVVVATTLFATVLTLMLSLFNYTLKINRRTEALRQASQGMRNFTEYITKEVRNGKIDYTNTVSAAECQGNYDNVTGYTDFLKIVNSSGENICIKWVNENGGVLKLFKNGITVQNITPTNMQIPVAKFHIRPLCDPATQCYVNNKGAPDYPGIQPFATIVMQFKVVLPSGEVQSIPYQTTISTDQYDVPHTN